MGRIPDPSFHHSIIPGCQPSCHVVTTCSLASPPPPSRDRPLARHRARTLLTGRGHDRHTSASLFPAGILVSPSIGSWLVIIAGASRLSLGECCSLQQSEFRRAEHVRRT